MYDIRDNKSYTVRKLPDGNCWMTSNLAYDLATGVQAIGSKNDRSTFTFTPTSCGANGICEMNGNTVILTYQSQITGQNETNWYYNWYAASGGINTTTNTDADGSICPVGWRLPPDYGYQVEKSYSNLFSYYGLPVNNASANSSVLDIMPLNFSRPGCDVENGTSSCNRTYYGHYWTSTAFNPTSAYVMRYYPAISSGWTPRHAADGDKVAGLSVRCVAL